MTCRHVVTCIRTTWRICVHVCACVCAFVCSYVHECNQSFKHPLKIFANHLSTRKIAFIFFMWDYLSFYIFAGDMVCLESSYRRELMGFNLSPSFPLK